MLDMTMYSRCAIYGHTCYICYTWLYMSFMIIYAINDYMTK